MHYVCYLESEAHSMVRAPVGQFRSSYLEFESTWNRFHVKDKYTRNPTPCKKNSIVRIHCVDISWILEVEKHREICPPQDSRYARVVTSWLRCFNFDLGSDIKHCLQYMLTTMQRNRDHNSFKCFYDKLRPLLVKIRTRLHLVYK